ncbi:unknown [Bacteroides sp. CAG:702]|nr:unknown [Bacteroides sp. CAG:702]
MHIFLLKLLKRILNTDLSGIMTTLIQICLLIHIMAHSFLMQEDLMVLTFGNLSYSLYVEVPCGNYLWSVSILLQMILLRLQLVEQH